MAHYTNPAFCQKSEFYPRITPLTMNEPRNPSVTARGNYNQPPARNVWQTQNKPIGLGNAQRIQQRELPPKPIHFDTNARLRNSSMQLNTSGYALVPLEELPSSRKDRYAILPPKEAYMRSSSLRSRSQDNLDFIPSEFGYEEEDSFTSLPPAFPPQEDKRKLVSAFSTDFINKSMILVDQNSMQRYTIVPTDDDEELVDSNHEIIEMHNGRAHRYAVIPTDEDDIGVLNESSIAPSIRAGKSTTRLNYSQHFPSEPKTPPKMKTQHVPDVHRPASTTKPQLMTHHDSRSYSTCGTPTKNAIATQKLHELLSTPRKSKQETTLQRQESYQTIIQRSPNQIQLQRMCETNQKQMKLSPQRIQYEDRSVLAHSIEQRTTAIISPRLHQESIYDDTTSGEKTWRHESFQKVENATATIGIVSLMLILTGILNSGLCLYMVTDMRRSFYLDIGIISGFAAAALGLMGFRSRQCYWLPNRNYISGYVLVTVFSLLNCCGLLVLLGLNPFPGTPIHDLATGVILALSSLILLIISLGVITSKWCIAPPPDNRVDVF